MREFILLALRAKTSDFDLENLSLAGRMDLVCRAISSALFVSDHVRKDTVIHVFLNGPNDPPKLISFFGDSIINIEPDEKSIAKLILFALKKGKNLKLDEEADVLQGIKISKKSFEKFIEEKSTSHLYYLNKKGKDIREIKFEENSLFILGDNLGIPKNTEKLLKRLKAEKISLGSVMLFASHCIVLVHNEIDRKSY